MFVVRIQNDEATLFRAFRHLASAKLWAGERNAEDAQSPFDILGVSSATDASSAVVAARSGEGVLLHRVEAVQVPAGTPYHGHATQGAPSDHAFA